jgi:hypothetical protein
MEELTREQGEQLYNLLSRAAQRLEEELDKELDFQVVIAVAAFTLDPMPYASFATNAEPVTLAQALYGLAGQIEATSHLIVPVKPH